ncbi:MAG: hypothetical protein VKJ46_11595 [Leptolyngbyaceae bacterium]|nr:hypothetical protein [Leptolyngbyaceae bacterium]
MLLPEFLLYACIGLLIATFGFGWKGFAIASLLILSMVAPPLMGLKSKVVEGLPGGVRLPPTHPEDFARLDTDALAQYTRDLEGLGFVVLNDFTMEGETGNITPVFARLFHHPHLHCFAEVTQFFPLGSEPKPLRCSIISHLDRTWKIGTTDREPDAFVALMRRPRKVGSCHPKTEPAELLKIHQERRQYLIEDLGLAVLHLSGAEYQATVPEDMDEIKVTLQRKGNFTFVFELVRFMLKPPVEWWGDYSTLARSRRRSQQNVT